MNDPKQQRSPLVNRPINVLHTRVICGSGGGPEKTILRSPGFLDKRRYRVAAAYIHPHNDGGIASIRDAAQALSVELHTIAERRALDRKTVTRLAGLCDDLQIDIWHSHDYKTDLLGPLIRRRRPAMKLVTTVHGFTRETLKTRLYARLNDAALLAFDHVFAVSPPLVRHCAMKGVHPDRLSYLPNAIDLKEYQRSRTTESAKQAFGIEPGTFAIGVVGRLSKEKGVDRAMRLFAGLSRENPAARLHIIGQGRERDTLTTLAHELNIASRVCWWGWRSDMRQLLEAMDFMLLTSHTEGIPNAMLEAMALGVPVAATDVGGVPDLLDHGESGLLLPSASPEQWAARLAPLLQWQPARADMARRAQRRVERSFDFDQRMQRVAAQYDRLCPTAQDTTRRPTPLLLKHSAA